MVRCGALKVGFSINNIVQLFYICKGKVVPGRGLSYLLLCASTGVPEDSLRAGTKLTGTG